MKKITYNSIIDNRQYKNIPIVLMTKSEVKQWECDAEQFYKSTYNDLSFRIEPYVIEPTE